MEERNRSTTEYDRFAIRFAPYSPYTFDRTCRVAIFLDVDSVTRKIRSDCYGMDLDFRKLLADLQGDRKCVLALAVDGTLHEDEEWSIEFQSMLRKSGFRVETVSASNNAGEQMGTDVKIALTAMRYASRGLCDQIILITGDSGCSVMVEELQREGVLVSVATFKEYLSGELKRIADSTHTLDEMCFVRIMPVRNRIRMGTE